MDIIIPSLEALEEAAQQFLEATRGRHVIALLAPMGAGKTTFTSALCRQLGVTDDVASPTFAIINEYGSPEHKVIYHFDCYRLRSLAEALDIGVEDYLASPHLCIIEWPEVIEPLLPDDTLYVRLEVMPDGARLLSF